jgi:hypothetical protein
MSQPTVRVELFNPKTGRWEPMLTPAQAERLRVHRAFVAAYRAALSSEK